MRVSDRLALRRLHALAEFSDQIASLLSNVNLNAYAKAAEMDRLGRELLDQLDRDGGRTPAVEQQVHQLVTTGLSHLNEVTGEAYGHLLHLVKQGPPPPRPVRDRLALWREEQFLPWWRNDTL